MTLFRSVPQPLPSSLPTPGPETAIIVSESAFLGDRPSGSSAHDPSVGPLTTVGGVPLLLRTLLVLQRVGFSHVVILAGPEEESLKATIQEDRRLTAVVRWMPIREFPLSDIRTWQALVQDADAACLVASTGFLFSRQLALAMRQEGEQRTADVVVPAHREESRAQASAMPNPPGLMLTSADRLTGLDAVAGLPPLASLMKRALVEGRLRVLGASHPACWVLPIRTSADVTQAERLLLTSTKTAYEGVIDRYFNRPVGTCLTRVFLWARWTPNAVTVLSLAIGFIAAVCFARGTYWMGVVGAVLFQLAAIIDCCDGDIARLTFQESRFGEQLDLIGDNVVHLALFFGLGWGVSRTTGSLLPLGLAAMAILGTILSFFLVTRMKARRDREGQSGAVQAARADFIINNMASRDFSVVILALAVLNQLHLFLWLAAIGATIFSLLTAWVDRSTSRGA